MNLDKLFFKKLPIRRKLLILIFGAVIPAAMVSGGLSLYLSTSAFFKLAGERFQRDLDDIAGGLNHILVETERDLKYLDALPSFRALLGQGSRIDPEVRLLSEQAFALLATHRPAYYQIRYLDLSGREILRVNQIVSRVEVVPAPRLQNKEDRYYFRELLELPAGGFYFSPLDLNVEYGQVEDPLHPTLRYGMVVESEGKKRGFLLINLHGSYFLGHLQRVHLPEGAVVLLLQQDGTLIAQKTEEGYSEHWTHGTGGKPLAGQLPERVVESLFSGQASAVYDSAGRQMVVHLPVKAQALPSDRYWILAMIVPRETILSPIWTIMKWSGGILALFFLFAGVIGIVAARRLSRPVQELKSASKVLASGAYGIALNIQTNDELEELAGDFQEMARMLKARDDLIRQHQEHLEETIRIRTREIAQEKDKLDCVIQGIGAGLALLDLDLKILWHNDRLAEWFGGDLLGKECYRLYRCTEDAQAQCHVPGVLESGSIESREMMVTLRDGRTIVCLNTARPIRDETGLVTHILYLSQDITEQRALEQKERLLREQLERAEKLATLGEFSAGIAHEVGNPLAAIKTSIQAMQEEIPSGHDHHAMLERVVGEVDRLSRVVRTFQVFARPKEIHREAHDLRLIVREVMHLMLAEAHKNRIRIIESYQEGMPPAFVDAQQIQQVLLNLILNAIQAMPGGGELAVEGRRVEDGARAGHLELSLADTGTGIDKEDLPRIFDPFFSTKPGGTGLGLSVAYNLVRHNGGELTVRSRRGKGTVFTVTLPAADAPSAKTGAARREHHAGSHPAD